MQSKVQNEELTTLEQTDFVPNIDHKIAESAYFKSESRGFESGHELEDWCEAELEFSK
jgi:hypothetical protein